ncbi:siderophore-interacting protein [Salinicola aestuarinus]|uniref:siderophore-interacting protein n=1 Tax=Salinicola aestuarinus TaxID=1949082 RepID=UPI000DA172BE|nr:siderophore-interacting protein [Salinicola aestuarinus]
MAKTPPRPFTVIARQQLTPHMLRLTLGGEGMRDFPADQPSAHIKLVFPTEGEARDRMRTYTVRDQRDDQIDVDFVLHDDSGPAASWAAEAQPGDEILVAGPGPVKRLPEDADWNLLVGDMTSLPAISANLERLPAHAVGHVIIEVASDADRQTLDLPEGIALDYRINPHPGSDSDLLLNAVRALDWPAGKPGIWVACEFSAMRKLRRHLIDDRGVDKRAMYISSYWKLGSNEDGHRVVKQEDAVSDAESA